MNPPEGLIAAFRSVERAEHLAALMLEDGWDAEAIRVLSAWQHVENTWEPPESPCPGGGMMPTPAAWAWLCSGWTVDLSAIAEGAGVSRARAADLMALLMRNLLVFPDGQMANVARGALRAHVAERLSAGTKKKKPPKPPTPRDDNDPN